MNRKATWSQGIASGARSPWSHGIRSSWAIAAMIVALTLAGSARAEAPQQQCVTNAIAGGTGDAITVPLLPCALSTNILLLTTTAANATTSPTLQMPGFPALPIVSSTGAAVSIGALPGGNAVVMLSSTGSKWLLLNSVASGGGALPGGQLDSTQFNLSGTAFGGAGPGTSGQVLTSNGVGVAPTFQASGAGVNSVVGTAGQTTASPTTGSVVTGLAAIITPNETFSGTTNFTGPLDINGTPQAFPTSGLLVGTDDAQTLTNKNINAGEVNSGTLAAAQMLPLASTDVYQGNGSGIPAAVSLSAALDVAIGSTQGDVLYRSSTGWSTLPPGTSGYFFQTQGSAANPTWAAASGGSGCSTGGSAGNPLTSNGAGGCNTVTVSSLVNGALSLGSSGVSGSVTLGNGTSGTVEVQPVTGALGTVVASVPANTGTIAETNLAQTFSALQNFDSGDLALLGSASGGVPYFSTGSVLASSAMLIHYGLVYGGGAAGAPVSLAAATNGQIPIGSTGSAPVLATITAGTGATVTNGAGTITISATGTAPTNIEPVYNVVLGYNAKCDGNPSDNDTSAFQAAITAIHASGAPGILYVPPPTAAGTTAGYGCMVTGGQLTISDNLVTVEGAGGMGGLNYGPGSGLGPSTITNVGSGSTFVISGNGSTIQDLAFNADGTQSVEYIDITGNQDKIKNVHAQNANLGINIANTGETWIDDYLQEGTTVVGGIAIDTTSAVFLHHVVMYQTGSQPDFGIADSNSTELVIDGGTDLSGMGTSFLVNPGSGQYVSATYVSDSFFDTGNNGANIYVAPTGSGYVLTMRFSNVWTSTNIASPTQVANGWTFDSSGVTSGLGITDVMVVNGLAQGFVGHDGMYINGAYTNGISVDNSVFGDNYDGILVGANTSNFKIVNSWFGNYVGAGANSEWGIDVASGTSDYYEISNNHIVGNTFGQLSDGGSGSNKIVTCNIGVASNACGVGVSNLTVGTTTIASGTSGDIEYNNGGVLGEKGVTGTGNVVLASAPSIASLTVTTGLTAAGLVTNADLVNDATTVNGQSCVLGGTCTVAASAATLGGTALNSTVLSSSLTSVGALSALLVTTNIISSSGSILLDSPTGVVAGGADGFDLVGGGGTGNHYVEIGTQGGGSANALGVLTAGTLAPISNNVQGLGTASSTWASIYGETYFAGASGASAGVACSGSPTSSFASVGGIVTHC